MFLRALVPLIAIALSLSASHANATLYTLSYTGFVHGVYASKFDGIDYGGVFGPSGGSLDGQPFESTFVIDSSKGAESTKLGDVSASGGEYFGVASPILSAELTIKGRTVNFPTFWLGTAHILNQGGESGAVGSVFLPDPSGEGAYPLKLVLLNTPAGEIAGGYFEADHDLVRAYLVPTTLSVTPMIPPAPVPEPTTWAMSILGAALVGAILRQRRIPGNVGSL